MEFDPIDLQWGSRMRCGRYWAKHGLRCPNLPTRKLFAPRSPRLSNSCRVRWDTGARQIGYYHQRSKWNGKRAVRLLYLLNSLMHGLPHLRSRWLYRILQVSGWTYGAYGFVFRRDDHDRTRSYMIFRRRFRGRRAAG